MICFISPSRKNSIKIRKTLFREDILSYQSRFPSLENTHGIADLINALPLWSSVALIDATSDGDFGNSVCKAIKEIRPKMILIVLYDKSFFGTEKFKYFSRADYEIDMSRDDEPSFSLAPLLASLGYLPEYEYGHLKLIKSNHSAIYLGLKMKLTQSEYRILLYMCTNGEKIFPPEEILAYCFAESYRMVSTNVKYHISHINKKSKALGDRKIILSVRGKGYKINDHM